MRGKTLNTLRLFMIELAIYAPLVVIYFLLVLRYLSGWLSELHHSHATFYALTAIALIIGQAVLLESVTSFLLRMIGGRSE
jgi:hypothetical protein